MEIKGLKSWGESFKRPLIIAGPCSAESEDQLYETAKAIKELGINIIRAGVWKPRTRPNSFEGVGLEALKWIRDIKRELGVSFATEVASPKHVEEALYHGVDILWIGARSTVNPFTVQDIADSLKGVDNPVLIKNPVNPDLSLWIGAVERVYNAGVKKLGAIHRGFSSYQKTRYRNPPQWKIPLDLKKTFPEMPLICDPSHIAGQRSILFEISQRAADLDYDGLIIETHRDPDNAWSDPKQQITPERLGIMLKEIKFRKPTSRNREYLVHLEEMREQIDQLDYELFEILAARMKIVDLIGHFKNDNNVTIFQKNRWKEIIETRSNWATKLDLNTDFAEELFKLIHENAIRRQAEIMNREKKKKMLESVIITDNTKSELQSIFSAENFTSVAVLVDENTKKECLPDIRQVIPDTSVIEIHSGEQFKNLQTCDLIWHKLTSNETDRGGLLINLGGGVIGDMGGFCAATFKRGIRFINIPTTLLAQVDASIGGKLGIDFQQYKNHIGLFTLPLMVIIDTGFLKSLPERELKSGFAEIIKHYLIADREEWDKLKTKPFPDHNWKHHVTKSVKIKSSIVEKDPLENGLRKVLNFGHTIGHAIESLFLEDASKPVLHGEAVAAGMICELLLSEEITDLDHTQSSDAIEYIITTFGKLPIDKKNINGIIERTKQDKKNEKGIMNFTLLAGIGKASYNIRVSASQAEKALLTYCDF